MSTIKRKKRKLTEFGIWVKKRLIELDMDQKELASMLNVSESYLADVLRGDKKGLKYITQITNLLDKEEKNRDELKGVI